LGFLARISVNHLELTPAWVTMPLPDTRAILNKFEFIRLNGNLVVPNLHTLTFSFSCNSRKAAP
jgi:hypothetical protein